MPSNVGCTLPLSGLPPEYPPAGLDAPPGTTFVMNETRRVRFYQRNYFDHPAFGVIALVLPVHRHS